MKRKSTSSTKRNFGLRAGAARADKPVKHPDPAVPFAHPSEHAFAELLDSYGIRWDYEPRTFVLERDATGNITCGFTPDFYLSDFDIYLELTTLQQRLINRKRQKIRLMRQQYPDVKVKLLNRRDMEWIGRKYGLPLAA